MIILRVAGEIGRGKELKQAGGGRNGRNRGGEAGNIARALVERSKAAIRGHGRILVQRTGTALAGEGEKDGVLAAGLCHSRQIRRAHEGEAEAVGAGGRLLLRLAGRADGCGRLGLRRGLPLSRGGKTGGYENFRHNCPPHGCLPHSRSPFFRVCT